MSFNTRIRPEIQAALGKLRARIRLYVLTEGVALVLVVLAVLFWLSLGIDSVWFWFSRLELPGWFRIGFDVLAVGLIAFMLVTWVALRFWRKYRTKALALVLERRFPQLNDRLITAVELDTSTTGRESELTQAMLQRTVDDVSRETAAMDVGRVFESSPLRNALIGATVLIGTIVGFGVFNSDAMARWYKAFVLHDAVYWDRESHLIMKVVSQPGDRVKHFVDEDGASTEGEPGFYKHPRGGDLTLVVELPKTKRPDGGDWIAPEEVELSYTRFHDGKRRARDTVTLSRLPDGTYRHSEGRLLESMEISITGGDFTNRKPYRVNVVDPPRVDSLVVRPTYPEYTRLNQTREEAFTVSSSKASLPVETRAVVVAAANKPLSAARIETDDFELRIERGAARLILTGEPGVTEPRIIEIPSAVANELLSDDGTKFSIPVHVAVNANALLSGLEQPLPIPIPPDASLRMYLEDADGISSIDPARLTIAGVIDQPPEVQTELTGVSNLITRKASIPVKGIITDDYGVHLARFEFKIDDGADAPQNDGGGDWRQRPLDNPPAEVLLEDNPDVEIPVTVFPQEFQLRQSKRADLLTGNEQGDELLDPYERFAVLPLDLKIGQKLTLTVYAEDGDNINGPHGSRSQNFPFTIVSEEDLLALLYTKEIGLRGQFEQVIREVTETRADLVLARDRYQQLVALRKTGPAEGGKKAYDENVDNLTRAILGSADRGLHQVRKNETETRDVHGRFGGILDELENNRVHTEEQTRRIRGLIMSPLEEIIDVDFVNVDRAVGRFRFNNERERDPTESIEEAISAVDLMLAKMQTVLKEMQDLAEFHEAIQRLKGIIDDVEGLKKETNEERLERLLGGPGIKQ